MRDSDETSITTVVFVCTYTTYLAQMRGQNGAQRWAAAAARRRLVATLDMYVPGGLAVEAFVGRIASPQALYQHRSGRNLAIEVFLALLLLHFEREPGPKNALRASSGHEHY